MVPQADSTHPCTKAHLLLQLLLVKSKKVDLRRDLSVVNFPRCIIRAKPFDSSKYQKRQDLFMLRKVERVGFGYLNQYCTPFRFVMVRRLQLLWTHQRMGSQDCCKNG